MGGNGATTQQAALEVKGNMVLQHAFFRLLLLFFLSTFIVSMV